MEAVMRTSYQGVANIIRFNWHFYVVAGISIFLLWFATNLVDGFLYWLCIVLAFGVFASTFISLCVSYFVYDRSNLYDFAWISQLNKSTTKKIVNIHAGFDETSSILKKTFSNASLEVFDFYDPAKHTEISIERARKTYPAYSGTVKITTSELPIADNEVDFIYNIFALHEVRNNNERILFLKEQRRILQDEGKIIVVEHLRDVFNFLAYNIGFFHFLPAQEWKINFQQAGLCIHNKFKITPFITVFILQKDHGNTP